MKVNEAMSPTVWTCRRDDRLSKAAGLMWDHDVGCLPVVDEEGRPVSMITDRDICMSTYLSGRSLPETAVDDAMSKSLVVVRPNQSIEEAEALMRNEQIRRLPVVSPEGTLLGIVTLGDVARAAGRRNDEVATTLKSIVRPHHLDGQPRMA